MNKMESNTAENEAAGTPNPALASPLFSLTFLAVRNNDAPQRGKRRVYRAAAMIEPIGSDNRLSIHRKCWSCLTGAIALELNAWVGGNGFSASLYPARSRMELPAEADCLADHGT